MPEAFVEIISWQRSWFKSEKCHIINL